MSSLLWVGEVFAATVVGFAVVVWLLSRRTMWGRQFRRLTFAYFRPTGRDWASWRPVGTVLLLLLMTVISVRISVLLSYSENGLYTAMQELSTSSFARFLGIFGVLATIHVVRSMFAYYVVQGFTIRWRLWLTEHMIDDWLSGQAYHRGQFTASSVDNPDQRIQEDVASFASDSAEFGIGVVGKGLSLVSFTVILWQLSGPLRIFGAEVPRAMTFLTYFYVFTASVIAFRIGRPLIRLNFLNENLAASFRYALVRLRDNSESVAFYRGETVEKAGLVTRFGTLIANSWAIVYRNIRLQGWNLSISQLAVVFPVVIQAPRFFSGALKLGGMQQTVTAFAQVHDSLSYFRNAYSGFAGYRATINRLTGLLDTDRESRALPALVHETSDELHIDGLTVSRPDGQPLVEDLGLHLRTGATLLVTGQSGSGKTTLLRSLAGLWPYANGAVSRPPDTQALFLSQQPYLPQGSLRAALAYPERPTIVDDEQARKVLRQVHLAQLSDRLDDEANWSRMLSPGEQQRLGFARILINRPRIAFLDEATSALDEGIENSLYALLCCELPDCILVSVGHRPTLGPLHANHLKLLGGGRWTLSATAETQVPTAA
ncbi:MAG: ABC transporter ATP-binding protein/permease [Pseudonocardia sp.]|nr:ABC transporter ATP-binding protein/permease [Pseudonocardia sp.]